MIELEQLNKQFVLKRITQEEIFERYLKLPVSYKRTYRNPLRIDKDGSCKFFKSKAGILYFKDWSWRSFDCFSFVAQYYLIEFKQAIYKICNDFNLADITIQTKQLAEITHVVKPVVFSFDIKKFDKFTLQYWKQYLNWITEKDLNQYGIYVLYRYYKDGELKYTNYNEQRYLYILGEFKYQMYAPNSKEFKFLTTGTKVIGLKSIDYSQKYVVITKSVKDWFLSRLMGINSIGVLSEGAILDVDVIISINKFEIAFTLFDNDWAGRKASTRFKKDYNTIPLIFPADLEKDLSDNLKKYGEHSIGELINEVKDYYNL
jgi:hypothetical protein